MMESWKPVVGHEPFYEVSDLGRVRNVSTGRILKERPLPNGRPRVSLAYLGKPKDAYSHRLVLEAFVGPCPEGMETLHWDDDMHNNRLSNLRWGTRTENMRDMSRNGGGNAGRTHCPAGHPYSEANTYIYPGGRKHRGCRACGRKHSENKRNRIKSRKANHGSH